MDRPCWFVCGISRSKPMSPTRCPETDVLPKPLVREVCHCVTWFWQFDVVTPHCHPSDLMSVWAKAHVKIARMILTIKLDGNWSSFQLANNTPPLSVTGSVIAPSARMECPVNENGGVFYLDRRCWFVCAVSDCNNTCAQTGVFEQMRLRRLPCKHVATM